MTLPFLSSVPIAGTEDRLALLRWIAPDMWRGRPPQDVDQEKMDEDAVMLVALICASHL